VVPALAIAVIAWMMTSLTRDEWLALLAVVAVAAVVFVASRPSRQAARAESSL
jgi:hypothetical protein